MEDELAGARVQAVPVAVVAVVVKVELRVVVVAGLGVVVKAAGRLVDEAGLLERVHHRLRFDFVDEVENVFLFCWFDGRDCRLRLLTLRFLFTLRVFFFAVLSRLGLLI